MIKKVLLGVAIIAAIIIGRVLFKVGQASGQFVSLETVLADRCESIEIAPGPEDIEIDHETGIAYIAATDRRVLEPRPRGTIFTLDLNDPDAVPIEILGQEPADFYSHGISLWRGPDGKLRLFAVNHPEAGETVEVFDIAADGGLIHIETITSPKMFALNDLVAVGARQFYATNDQKYKDGIGAALELFLGLPLGEVIYFDGEETKKVASGFAFANGVNTSLDGSQVYVTETIGRKLAVFERDKVSGALSKRRNYGLGTGADNIDIAPDGTVYIGAHPKLLAFTKHASDPDAVSPSQVIRFDPVERDFESVYVSQNGELNGSATGAYWNDTLLVGGVFDSHIARCSNVDLTLSAR